MIERVITPAQPAAPPEGLRGRVARNGTSSRRRRISAPAAVSVRPVPVFELGPRGLVSRPPIPSAFKEHDVAPDARVTVIVPLRHMTPANAIESLQDVVGARDGRPEPGADLRIGEVRGASKLILTGRAVQVEHALRILQAVDVPAAEASRETVVTVLDLEHADVQQVRSTMNELFRSGSRHPASPAPQFVVDERTQKLIVVASKEETMQSVAAIVKELDIPVASPRTEIRGIRVKHLSPEDAVPRITGLLGSRSESRTTATSARSARAVRRIPSGPRVDIVPHAATNSLLIRATPEVFTEIEQILELIDVPPSDGREDPVNPSSRGKDGNPPAAIPVPEANSTGKQ